MVLRTDILDGLLFQTVSIVFKLQYSIMDIDEPLSPSTADAIEEILNNEVDYADELSVGTRQAMLQMVNDGDWLGGDIFIRPDDSLH